MELTSFHGYYFRFTFDSEQRFAQFQNIDQYFSFVLHHFRVGIGMKTGDLSKLLTEMVFTKILC